MSVAQRVNGLEVKHLLRLNVLIAEILVPFLGFNSLGEVAVIGGGKDAGLDRVGLDDAVELVDNHPPASLLAQQLSPVFVLHLLLTEVAQVCPKSGIVFLQYLAE
jgi:hypothetical protein